MNGQEQSINNTTEEKINEKQEEWGAILDGIDRIVDAKGLGVDSRIKNTIAAIKINGLGTTGSCEGHGDRGFPYPWVEVESDLSEMYSANLRYRELKTKARNENRGGDKMFNEEKVEYRNIVESILASNLVAYDRLSELLDEFNEVDKENTLKLGIKKGPWNQSMLRPEGVPEGRVVEIKEYLSTISKDEIENNLESYRELMDRFSEFAKNKFFNELSQN